MDYFSLPLSDTRNIFNFIKIVFHVLLIIYKQDLIILSKSKTEYGDKKDEKEEAREPKDKMIYQKLIACVFTKCLKLA